MAPAMATAADDAQQHAVRGSAESFQQGSRPGPNGFGFSVQTAPGVSVDMLARGGSFPGNPISLATVRRLQAVPGVTVRAPTPGFGVYESLFDSVL